MNHSKELNFEIFPWNRNLETGITSIDDQHMQLVAILNSLADHLAERSSLPELGKVFDQLIAYTDYHFNSEEDIWRTHFRADDDWLIQHEESHLSFVAAVSKFKAESSHKVLDEIVSGMLGFLTNWLAYHILDNDRRMALAVLGLQSGLSLEVAKKQADDQMTGATKVLIDTVLSMYDSLSSRTLELLRERSARKLAEQALKASEERWKFILDGMGEGVWDWDISADEISRSSDCLSLSNFIGGPNAKNGAAEIHADDLLRFRNDLQAHLCGITESFSNEHRVVHPDGRWSWVLTRGKVTSRDHHGKPLRMIGTHSDITEREMAALIFSNTSEGMMVTDADARIIAINPSFTAITGYALEEVFGKNASILHSGRQDHDFYDAMWDKIRREGNWSAEVWSKRKNGEIYPEQLTINTVFNPDGTPNYHIALFNDLTEQKCAQEQLWRKTNFDVLTGMPNRGMLIDRLGIEIGKASRQGQTLALLYIDLDHFKDVNTTHGHAVGDLIIKEASQRLMKCVRTTDTVARLSGDEFAIVLAGIDDYGVIDRVAQHALDVLGNPFIIHESRMQLSASLGISVFPEDATDADSLLKYAEQAMYTSKNQGRNQLCYFTRFMQEASQIRAVFADQLCKGLQNQQFELHYQPIVNLRDGTICKAEALIRWNHPELGVVSPATFIPIAEETRLIIDIGDWVFYEATRQLTEWRRQFNPDFQVSINKSPIQFRNNIDAAHHNIWINHLRQQQLPGNCLIVEITEGLMMESDPAILEQILGFRDFGIEVALDDFGTGYSSLSYLSKFDIDYIKIDRSFVKNLEKGHYHLSLCEAIVLMAHKLGLEVVAEGIETAEQRNLLVNAGCDYGQGYLFSKPVPAKEFERMLSRTG